MPYTDENRIQMAIHAIKTRKVLSIRRASELYSVPRTTPQDRVNGITSRKEKRANSHKLSIIE
jgi:hypothetical protein